MAEICSTKMAQQARSFEHLLFTPKSGVFYTFQSAKRSKENKFGLYPNKAGGPPRSAALMSADSLRKTPEPDYNLVYAKVLIPERSTSNRMKGNSTKETPKTAELRQLVTDPNLANTMVPALPS